MSILYYEFKTYGKHLSQLYQNLWAIIVAKSCFRRDCAKPSCSFVPPNTYTCVISNSTKICRFVDTCTYS